VHKKNSAVRLNNSSIDMTSLMISVEEAEAIIFANKLDFGKEQVVFQIALGRVTANDLIADRDLPPYDRVTMDGIALKFDSIEKGTTSFRIKGVQAAGETCLEIEREDECIEIMTGAVLPSTCDTVIRYEDLSIENGSATITTESIKRNQNVHFKGSDRKQNDIVARQGSIVTPAVIGIAASVGALSISVKKLPAVLVISTGDELVEVSQTPGAAQIRSSNKYVIQSALKPFGINADLLHLVDDKEIVYKELSDGLSKYNVIILSGGVSKGKFDHIPEVLQQLSVKKLFHRVKQKPGKPFWFGMYDNRVPVFAFPGNPVSVFLCVYRYFIPWLKECLGISKSISSAILDDDVIFKPELNYFLPVILKTEEGRLLAFPVPNNGSGDFAAIAEAHAFLELPAERSEFKKGEVLPVWIFNPTFF
jgi:molybdopterin molybdotransferase